MKLYVIKDVIAGRFATDAPVLTLMNNDQEALRALKAVGAGKNIYTEKAEDIQLWCVGTFDNETGLIENNKPYLIGNLIDFIKPEVLAERDEGKIELDIGDIAKKDFKVEAKS